MNGYFAHLGNKHITTYPNDIANIHKPFESSVVQGFIFTIADIVAFDVQLYAPAAVLQIDKRGSAHNAACHDTAGNTDFLKSLTFGGKI